MHGVFVAFDQKVHNHFMGIHVDQLWPDARFRARQHVVRSEIFNQFFRVREKVFGQILAWFRQCDLTELLIFKEHACIKEQNFQEFGIDSLQNAIVFASDGGDGRRTDVDVAVNTAGEVDAEERIFDVRYGVDTAANFVGGGLFQDVVDAFEWQQAVVLSDPVCLCHLVAERTGRIDEQPVSDVALCGFGGVFACAEESGAEEEPDFAGAFQFLSHVFQDGLGIDH